MALPPLRRKRWEEWKRREVEACPPKDRKKWRKLLDGIPMPTVEDDRRLEEAKKMVESVFGNEPRKRKKHGKKRQAKG